MRCAVEAHEESMTQLSGFARRSASNSNFQRFQHFQQLFNINMHKEFCANCYILNNSTIFQQSFQLSFVLFSYDDA